MSLSTTLHRQVFMIMRAWCVCIIQYGIFVDHGIVLIVNQPNKHKNDFLSHNLVKQGQGKLFPYQEKPYKKAFIIGISIPKQHCHLVTLPYKRGQSTIELLATSPLIITNIWKRWNKHLKGRFNLQHARAHAKPPPRADTNEVRPTSTARQTVPVC
jgi:hypothetical protein